MKNIIERAAVQTQIHKNTIKELENKIEQLTSDNDALQSALNKIEEDMKKNPHHRQNCNSVSFSQDPLKNAMFLPPAATKLGLDSLETLKHSSLKPRDIKDYHSAKRGGENSATRQDDF